MQPAKRQNFSNVYVNAGKIENPALVAFGKILIIYEGTHYFIKPWHRNNNFTALNACSIIASTLLLNLLTLCPWQPFSFEYTDGYFLYKAAHEEVLLKKYNYSNYFMKLNHHLRWQNKCSFNIKLDRNALNYYYITILYYNKIYSWDSKTNQPTHVKVLESKKIFTFLTTALC